MAAITLLDGGSYIEVQYSAAHKVTIPKLGLKTKLKNGELLLYWDSAWENKAGRPWIQLDPDDISSPTVANVAALRTLILGWIDTQAVDDGGGGSYYVGKPSNGDFITAYTSAETITFSGLPSDVTDITDEDIELVRQISTAGEVTAEYERGDAAMSVTANVLTVTGAAFVNTDTFVVFTNILGASGSSGGGGINPDYKIPAYGGTATYASNTTITLAGDYPTINDSSQIIYIKYVDETLNTADIFYNGVGGVLIEHSTGTLTIVNAGTPFAATNSYEVGMSNIPISLDIGSDTTKTTEQAPDYGHFTDIEPIVNVTDATVDQHYSSEIFPASYKYMALQLTANAVTGAAGVVFKIWATLNPDAATPADLDAAPSVDWFDVSEEILGAITVTLGTAATESDGYFIDMPTMAHKYIVQYDPGHATNTIKIFLRKY